MKAIVTGGAGFIGSHLVDALLNEHIEVTVLDNFSTGRLENLAHVQDQIELVECDLAVKGEWDKHFVNVDWVLHLAALADIVPSIQQPATYYRTNVDGTFNVLQAAKNAKVKRFIYAASSSCYGIPENYPTSEQAEIRPQYPYALTKRLGEELVLHWALVYGLPSLSLRFFNVYGFRHLAEGPYATVMAIFEEQKKNNKALTITSDGEQRRDFTNVDDIVDGLIKMSKDDWNGEIFNLGTGRNHSINELAELFNPKSIEYIPKRPGEADVTLADISFTQEKLSWKPLVSIEDYIKDFISSL